MLFSIVHLRPLYVSDNKNVISLSFSHFDETMQKQ